MRLGSPGGDPQLGPDLVVRAPGGDESDDLTLSRGQVGAVFTDGVAHDRRFWASHRPASIPREVYLSV
jgi:hypothetical protein